MPQLPQLTVFWRRATQVRGFLATLMFVVLSTSQVPSQIVAADLYPADFDPLYDLPLPQAWHDTEGFDTTSEALLDQIANQTKVRVRVDPRLPAVESERLDEDQRTEWAEDQIAAQQALLARMFHKLAASPSTRAQD